MNNSVASAVIGTCAQNSDPPSVTVSKAASLPVVQIVQHLGVSEPTFARWRAQYGSMKSDEAKRLKELEVENTRLKKLVADQALDIAVLKEANTFLGKHQRRTEGGSL